MMISQIMTVEFCGCRDDHLKTTLITKTSERMSLAAKDNYYHVWRKTYGVVRSLRWKSIYR
jgi:hypothetical protein